MFIKKKLPVFLLTIFFFIVAGTFFVSAQTAPDNAKKVEELNNKIKEYESKISELKSQGDSLTSQIGVMDNQIKLTEYRMNATKQEIEELENDITAAGKRMSNLEGSLQNVTKVLLNRIVATYQTGNTDALQLLLSSQDVSDLMSRANYLQIVQERDKRLLYDTQQAKNDYANQKSIFEGKKKKIEALKAQLEEYTKQLDADKQNKQKLLAETQGSEKNYQRMLADARAQIAGFRSFARAQGGSILPPQASPNGWYYNQRDERWGRNYIGNSSDTVWEVGCLVTSTAMILKNSGQNITPADVAANTSYFVSGSGGMKIPWAGGRFTSKWEKAPGVLSSIDAKLSSGQPVIVGVNVTSNSVGTHFLVLKSGSNGSYIMNDPWNGANLNFSDYYSTSQIFQYGYLN